MNPDSSSWVWSIMVPGGGVLLFGSYLCLQVTFHRRNVQSAGRGTQDRPWRVQGAAICLLLSVMFFLGVNCLDGRRNPRAFILFWLTMLVLVFWACVLAWVDIRRTRRDYHRARQDRTERHDRETDP